MPEITSESQTGKATLLNVAEALDRALKLVVAARHDPQSTRKAAEIVGGASRDVHRLAERLLNSPPPAPDGEQNPAAARAAGRLPTAVVAAQLHYLARDLSGCAAHLTDPRRPRPQGLPPKPLLDSLATVARRYAQHLPDLPGTPEDDNLAASATDITERDGTYLAALIAAVRAGEGADAWGSYGAPMREEALLTADRALKAAWLHLQHLSAGARERHLHPGS